MRVDVSFKYIEKSDFIKNVLDSSKPIDDFLECIPGAPVFKGLREKNAVSN